MAEQSVDILRRIASGGLAGAIAGILVAGVGGRLVMRAAAALNPGATGARTENGELIGVVTANGTLALLVFGGLIFGVIAGIVWVVVSPWLPGGRWRLPASAVAATAIGAPLVVRSDNPDFRILAADGPILAMLLGLVTLVGLAIAWLDGRLDRRLPRPGSTRLPLGLIYGVVTLFGLLFLPIAVGFYLSSETCVCANPPSAIGLALLAVGGATAVTWANRIESGRSEPPPAVSAIGRLGLLAAVGLGTIRIADELARILAAG